MYTVDASAEQPFDLNKFLAAQRMSSGDRSSLEAFCKLAAPRGRFQPADEMREEYEFRPYPKWVQVDGREVLVEDEQTHRAIVDEVNRRAAVASVFTAETGSASTSAASGEDEATEYARLAQVLRDAGHTVHANTKLATLRDRVAALQSGE